MMSQPLHSSFNLGFSLHPLGASFPVEGCIEVVVGKRFLRWDVPSSIVPEWRQGPDIVVLRELFLWACELHYTGTSLDGYAAFEDGVLVYSKLFDGEQQWHVERG